MVDCINFVHESLQLVRPLHWVVTQSQTPYVRKAPLESHHRVALLWKYLRSTTALLWSLMTSSTVRWVDIRDLEGFDLFV